MSLSGDLSTLELADLLQNLETHQKSGVLTVESEEDAAHLFFKDGCLALFARKDRAGLMEVLIASGTICEEDYALASKKRRRTGKSLGEVLVKLGVIDRETLLEIARARLLDEACELVTAKRGAFRFSAGGIPRGLFDPEERCLELRLKAGPLLLEAARREDHWQLIRQRVPSDGAHFVAKGQPRGLSTGAEALAAEVLPLLDGSHSVTEVVAAFPHRRFEVYQLLSDLAEERTIRAVGPDEWLSLIAEARGTDKARAERLLERALSANPHHIDLLTQEVALAQDLDEMERAVDALKMVIHLAFESGDVGRARRELARGRQLAPGETAFLERSVRLSLEDGDSAAAVRDGLSLVELWRKPGLHARAVELLEQLLAACPNDERILFSLAQSRADCGDLVGAVQPLMAHGHGQLATGDDAGAQRTFRQVCKLDPRHAGAKEQLAAIERGDITKARARRSKRWQRAKFGFVLAILLGCFVVECLARGALIEVESTIARERMIEEGRYDEAAERYAVVIDRFPASLTAQWNVRRHLADLALKGGKPVRER